MTPGAALVSTLPIERRILLLRKHKVMLDADLAELYGVSTKRLNEQVKRNRDRFPADFMFRLTTAERAEVVVKCAHLSRLRFSPALPYAFTEHGAIMLASILNSPVAVRGSIQVVRAFIAMREALAANKGLTRKLASLERKYDAQFKAVFDAIRRLVAAPTPSRPRIGFRPHAAE
jgi:ORF6N domain